MRLTGLAAAAMIALVTGHVAAQEPLRLFAAGSLRKAMTDIAAAYTRETGRAVQGSFGFSGLMRERIARGEPADLFASADMGHPKRLRREGRVARMVLFARNTLCVVALPGMGLRDDTVDALLLDPALPLGIFPAVQDPVGDYTLELFRRIGTQHPGAEAALRARAVVIAETMVGRPLTTGEDPAAALLREGLMRLHVSYCTTARVRLAAQLPGLEIAVLPAALQVGPAYGLAVLRGAHPGAEDLALFVLGEEGQRRARFGFTPVGLP